MLLVASVQHFGWMPHSIFKWGPYHSYNAEENLCSPGWFLVWVVLCPKQTKKVAEVISQMVHARSDYWWMVESCI